MSISFACIYLVNFECQNMARWERKNRETRKCNMISICVPLKKDDYLCLVKAWFESGDLAIWGPKSNCVLESFLFL